MRNTEFAPISDKEKKMRLYCIFKEQSKNKLPEEIIESILEKIHLKKQYYINVFSIKKRMVRYCTLRDFKYFKENEYSGELSETCRVVHGTVIMGNEVAEMHDGQKTVMLKKDAEIMSDVVVVIKESVNKNEIGVETKDEILVYIKQL